MSKRGGNKLKYQIERAIDRINRIGVSKSELRSEGKMTGIHSLNQIEHALSVNQNFGKWLKEQGVKDLFQLKRSHYRDYIAFMQTKGVSNGHLINVETNLRLLEKGMAEISKDKGHETRSWIPKERLISPSEREKPQDRSVDTEKLSELREKLPEGSKIAFDLQRAFGLRLREAANTKTAHIVERDGKLYWVASSDKNVPNTAKGVTKAGRGRETPCMPSQEARVREILEMRGNSPFVCPNGYNTLKSAYSRVGLGGSHSLRHTYAREMFKIELEQKGIANQGREMIQRILENRSGGYRKDHQVRAEEKGLYREVVKSMDKVQLYLGHGNCRIDLAEVYLGGV